MLQSVHITGFQCLFALCLRAFGASDAPLSLTLHPSSDSICLAAPVRFSFADKPAHSTSSCQSHYGSRIGPEAKASIRDRNDVGHEKRCPCNQPPSQHSPSLLLQKLSRRFTDRKNEDSVLRQYLGRTFAFFVYVRKYAIHRGILFNSQLLLKAVSHRHC